MSDLLGFKVKVSYEDMSLDLNDCCNTFGMFGCLDSVFWAFNDKVSSNLTDFVFGISITVSLLS